MAERVRFVLRQEDTEYSQELYLKIHMDIRLWTMLTSESPRGNVTYEVITNEREGAIKRVQKVLTNPETIACFGILQSGIWRNGQHLGWLEDKELSENNNEPQEPADINSVWSKLKKCFGIKVIKA